MKSDARESHVDLLDRGNEALVWYCAGCNARFEQISTPGRCPQCGAAVSDAPPESFADTVIIGSGAPQSSSPADGMNDELVGSRLHVYRCDSLLGRGGMGRVYLAIHETLERRCALKILSPKAAAGDVDYVQRFQHEGRAAAALVHPNIITTHAIGQDGGYHFLEMEFVPGRSLQHLIRREGRLMPVRATVLAAQIAEGLAAAHRVGIVHRDLKPDNVLMTHHGIPKIADFGLAKRIRTEDGLPSQSLIGTPNFMAPELFQGHDATPASDVYALGVCFFLLLTGRFPHTATTLPALQEAVIHDPLPNVRASHPDIPLEITECLSLLLAKTPANRPRDGIEAAQLLRAVAGTTRDLESLLREAFGEMPDVVWTRCENRYRLCLTLPDGRRQVLFIEPSTHGISERLLLIYSICCPAQPEYYEPALRLNAEIPHGGLGIREIEGRPMFVMGDTYPRATVDGEEVRRSALEVAYRADAVEKLLTGADHH